MFMQNPKWVLALCNQSSKPFLKNLSFVKPSLEDNFHDECATLYELVEPTIYFRRRTGVKIVQVAHNRGAPRRTRVNFSVFIASSE